MTATWKVNVVHEEVRVFAAVEGADPIPVPYTRRGETYRPTRISVEYFRVAGGEWKSRGPKVTGPKVKKDGTDSTVPSKNGYGQELPDWVDEFVTENWPGAS